MRLIINGRERELPDGATVADMLKILDVERGAVAVEVNRTIVPRSRHTEHELKDGDVVEIVTFVGGG